MLKDIETGSQQQAVFTEKVLSALTNIVAYMKLHLRPQHSEHAGRTGPYASGTAKH